MEKYLIQKSDISVLVCVSECVLLKECLSQTACGRGMRIVDHGRDLRDLVREELTRLAALECLGFVQMTSCLNVYL